MSQIIGILSQTIESHCIRIQKEKVPKKIHAFVAKDNAVQWLSMVWDKIPTIWDIIDLANNSLDWYDDLTKSEHHGNSNAGDTKK